MGSELLDPLVVRVVDDEGRGIPGVAVTWAAPAGAGHRLSSGSTRTGEDGRSGTRLTLGPRPGTFDVVAAVEGLAPAVFRLSADPGPPAVTAILTDSAQTGTAGEPVAEPPAVRVTDAFDNPLAGVEVSCAVEAGGGSVTHPGGDGGMSTAAGGVAAVAEWRLGATPGENVLRCQASDLAPVRFRAIGEVGAPARLVVVAGQDQESRLGAIVEEAPVVRAEDGHGNAVPGVVVEFVVTAGGGRVDAALATTDAAGLATAAGWAVGPEPGGNTLEARITGVTPVAFRATAVVGPPASAGPYAGQGQTGPAGAPVPTPPAVRITDATGYPVSGVEVTFRVVAGGGALAGATPVTDAEGVAAVDGWTLGTTAGAAQAVEAVVSLESGPAAVPFEATALAGAADRLEVDAGDGQSAPVASPVPVPPAVRATDAYGNPVQGVTVQFAISGGSGSLDGATAETGADGVAAVGGWILGTGAGEQTVRATAEGLDPVTLHATALAGPADALRRQAGEGQSATVGSAVSIAPAVRVEDLYGNPVAGVSVQFAVEGGGGSVTAATVQTGADGIAVVGGWTLGIEPGDNALSATVAGVDPIVFHATATVGNPTSVEPHEGDDQTVTAGSAVPVAPAVRVLDGFGNPVVGVSVEFAVASGGGAVTGSSASSGPDGVARVGSWTLGTAPGTQTLSATAAGLGPVTFAATAVPPTVAELVAQAGDGQTAVVGTAVAVPPAVLALDSAGDPVHGVTVDLVPAGAESGSVTGGTPTTGPDGIATVGSWTLGEGAGEQHLTARVADGPEASFLALAIADAPAVVRIVAGDSQSATVGAEVPIPPAVEVVDRFGNPADDAMVTFAVTGGGGSVTGPTPVTGVDGRAAVGGWILGPAPGANALAATVDALDPVTFTATGTPLQPDTVEIHEGDGQTAVATTPVATPPAVRVLDAAGGPVEGIVVTFVVETGGGSVTAATPTTGADGVARVGSWTLGTAGGLQTMSAAVAGLASVLFEATALTPAVVEPYAGDGQSSPVATVVPVPPAVRVLDDGGAPLPGLRVTFRHLAPAGGSVTGGDVVTDGAGVATAGSWTLSDTAGTNTLEGRVEAFGLAAELTATGTAADAAVLVKVAGDSQTVALSEAVAVPPVVAVRDVHGNGVPGMPVTFQVAAGGGSISAPVDTTDAAGEAAVGGWTVGAEPGANLLRAEVAGLEPVTFVATAESAAPDTLVHFAGNDQEAEVGTAVPVPPAVLALDAAGDPLPGVAVDFHVPAAGNGAVLGGQVVTGVDGVAAVEGWMLDTLAHENTLMAAAPGATPLPFVARGVPGPAAAVTAIDGDAQTAEVGTAVAIPPSVRVTDRYGNRIEGETVTFAVTGGGGSVSGATPSTDTAGLAAVGDWILGPDPGTNTLSATAAALDPATFTAEALPAAPNLWIEGVHLNQANQTPDGAAGGVAGRAGLLRVVVAAAGPNEEAPDVRVRLFQDGSLVREEVIPAPGPGVPVAPDLAYLTDTWNLALGEADVVAGLTVEAVLDPDGTARDGDPSDNRYPDGSGTASLDVQSMPPLDLVFVPVYLRLHGSTGDVSAGNVETYLTSTRRWLPTAEVPTTIRATYTSDQDLTQSSGWSGLLAELRALRLADAPPAGVYYHGIVQLPPGSAWGGIGYLPGSPTSDDPRVAVSGQSASTVAHELGHNLGRPHSPCGGPASPDPDYPYPDAQLGFPGYDIYDGSLVTGGTYRDYMSYCWPRWTSDYTFDRIIDWRHADPYAGGGAAPATAAEGPARPGVLVWGAVGADGVRVEPALALEARPTEDRGDGVVRGLAEDGTELFRRSFATVPVADGEPDLRHFAVFVPLPESARAGLHELVVTTPRGAGRRVSTGAGRPGPLGVPAVARVQVRGAGRMGVLWDDAAYPMALVRDRDTGRILALLRTGDAELAAPGRPAAALEVLLSDGTRTRAAGRP